MKLVVAAAVAVAGCSDEQCKYEPASSWNVVATGLTKSTLVPESVGDLDGDGIPDVVVPGTPTSARIFTGNGDGTFRVSQDLESGGDAVGATLAVGGNVFAMTGLFPGPPHILWFPGSGGVFGPPRSSATFEGVDGAIALADFNGDGVLDAVIGGNGTENRGAQVFLGDGTGGFQPGAAFNFSPTGSLNGVTSLAAADLAGDGHIDIALDAFYFYDPGSSGNGTYMPAPATAFGHGDGTFDIQPASWPANSQLAIADVDGDGHNDVISSSGTGIAVRLATGAIQKIADEGYKAVVARDLDRDGNVDLVAAFGGTGIRFFMGHGDGTFSDPVWVGGALITSRMALADLDHNGGLDVVAMTYDQLMTLSSTCKR